jgi:hypothetical protein
MTYKISLKKVSWKALYDMLVIILSRGVSSIIMLSSIGLKSYYVDADEFASLGYMFAGAGLVIAPIVSPVGMIISRRIIESKQINTDRIFIILWISLASILATYAVVDKLIHPLGASDASFAASIAAFILILSLGSQYIIWLNECGFVRLSIITSLLFIISIPASFIIRGITGIGQNDRSFGVETVVLIVPVLIAIAKAWRLRASVNSNLYEMSVENYFKYVLIITFYSLILFADWQIAQQLLPQSDYQLWAEDRIILERALLPILNVIQVTMLWKLLRASTGKSHQKAEKLSDTAINRFIITLIIVAGITILFWLFAGTVSIFRLVPIVIGYLAFGLTSTFLDFYQARYKIGHLLLSLFGLSIVRIIACFLAIQSLGIWGYSIFWGLSSLAILGFMFYQSKDLIKVGSWR